MMHFPKTRADWLALRVPVITSTEAPALFEESPYTTHFELWHQKHDNVIVEIDSNERKIAAEIAVEARQPAVNLA